MRGLDACRVLSGIDQPVRGRDRSLQMRTGGYVETIRKKAP